MDITLKQAVAARQAFGRLITRDMSGKTVYKLSLTVKAFSTHMESFDQAQNDLLRRYGVPVENASNAFRFETRAKFDEYEKEYNDLLALTMTLPDWKLPFSVIDKISAEDLALLDWLIDGEAKAE